ncbi:hypothetical protein LDENG_00287650, partial [Lucifuga dentata]
SFITWCAARLNPGSNIVLSLYCYPLITSFITSYHFYTDTQLYISFTLHDPEKLSTINNCYSAIKEWMFQNFLQINCDKTEILWIGSDTDTVFSGLIGPVAQNIKPCVKNLGVMFDPNLKFESHVKSLFQFCSFSITKHYKNDMFPSA